MWSRRGTKGIAAAALISAALSACSEHYIDRRDTISIVSGEAMAANRVTHMIDPWSPASARRHIAYSGEKAATASERYRTGRVINPFHAATSSVGYSQGQQATQAPTTSQSSASGGQIK
jgi:hypothetical protein